MPGSNVTPFQKFITKKMDDWFTIKDNKEEKKKKSQIVFI